MLNRMMLTCLLALGLISFMGCSATFEVEDGDYDDDGVLVHIHSGPDEAHRVLMALHMAKIMADTQPVLVYFDIDAVHVVMKDAQAISMQPFGSSDDLIKSLRERDVTLMVCPGCLKAAGKTPEQVRPEVIVADKKQLFSFAEGRIITLDY